MVGCSPQLCQNTREGTLEWSKTEQGRSIGVQIDRPVTVAKEEVRVKSRKKCNQNRRLRETEVETTSLQGAVHRLTDLPIMHASVIPAFEFAAAQAPGCFKSKIDGKERCSSGWRKSLVRPCFISKYKSASCIRPFPSQRACISTCLYREDSKRAR